MRVEVLHRFRVLVDGRFIALSEGSQRLIGCLAVADQPRPRTTLAGTLWPERSERDAHASLRQALWRLNRHVSGLLEQENQHIGLARGTEVDLHEIYRLSDAVSESEPRVNRQAVRLLEGDLLPEWSYDWLDGHRESLRQVRLHTLEALARNDLNAGRTATALVAALAAVGLDQLRESAQRIVIAAHLAEGNTAEAVRQYVRFRDLLWEELQLRPSRQLQEMLPEGAS
ncbi:AfsR/SARP family transcriptional regulator [Micromonospora sp. WMMD558]|uniref:AfsR/SARP family transcriptional regulator n=1 Tax=unclassified Micromonospora TaxID=2617518 RepID=UPI0018AF65F6|nr:BTAD domain-containing putative transcriptional regulator [Micromonospora sp. WMMC415]